MTPTPPRRRHVLMLPALPLLAAGCALAPLADPPRVTLVGLDGLPGEGLELRFRARLRVQNPSEAEVAFEGVSLELDLRGQPFASGVAPVAGRVPAFGETVVSVPVTVSGLSIARQIFGLVRDGDRAAGIGKVPYALRGRLGGVFGGVRFATSGEFDFGG